MQKIRLAESKPGKNFKLIFESLSGICFFFAILSAFYFSALVFVLGLILESRFWGPFSIRSKLQTFFLSNFTAFFLQVWAFIWLFLLGNFCSSIIFRTFCISTPDSDSGDNITCGQNFKLIVEPLPGVFFAVLSAFYFFVLMDLDSGNHFPLGRNIKLILKQLPGVFCNSAGFLLLAFSPRCEFFLWFFYFLSGFYSRIMCGTCCISILIPNSDSGDDFLSDQNFWAFLGILSLSSHRKNCLVILFYFSVFWN